METDYFDTPFILTQQEWWNNKKFDSQGCEPNFSQDLYYKY